MAMKLLGLSSLKYAQTKAADAFRSTVKALGVWEHFTAARCAGIPLLGVWPSTLTFTAVVANKAGSSLTEVGNFFMTEFERPSTEVRYMDGPAMAPTFAASTAVGARGEKLLVRKLCEPSSSTVFVGDVVAVQIDKDKDDVLIRRVMAAGGQEMVSSCPDDAAFYLEPNTCWVLADNETLPVQEAVDSRTLGPIDYSTIVGRVVYFSSSEVDHGTVENSEEAMEQDAPVMECELDVDEFCKPPEEKL